VDLRAGLDAMEKRKILPLPGIEPGRPARSPLLPTELSLLLENIYIKERKNERQRRRERGEKWEK
jgi:hypothetical protein